MGIDEATSDGDTALALIARVAGPRTGTMRWIGSESPSPSLEITPAPGITSIEIAVTSSATGASYRPTTANHRDGGIACFGQLTVAAVAHVATGDGGFDEQWPISLDDGDGPDSAHFIVDLRAQPVNGSFRLVDPDAASWDSTTLGFDASFAPGGGASGSVYYGASRVRGDSHQGYSTSVALWTAPAATVDAAVVDAIADRRHRRLGPASGDCTAERNRMSRHLETGL